jgi:beta-glucosidase
MQARLEGGTDMNNPIFSILPAKAASSAFCLMIGVMLLTPVQAMQDAEQGAQDTPAEIVIFDGNNVAPWRMYLGSSTNWSVAIEGPETKSYKSNIITVKTADYEKRDDAYQAEWEGGLGQVYWQADQAWDITALAEQDAALSIVIRIDEAPKKSVDLKMDCGYPCAGSLNMTQLFKTVPKGQWFRVSFKINCFKEAGANLAHIVAPLVVATKGAFKMSFADVRLLKNPPPESVIACG